MKFLNLLIILFSFVNCDLDHDNNRDHGISDGHSSEHSYRRSHIDTGFNIEYIGDSVVKNYEIFTNFENEIENRYVLDNINYNYTINNYANNIEPGDSVDHKLECLYYSKIFNDLNYTILIYDNVSFRGAMVNINYDYSYCLKNDIHEHHDDNHDHVLMYPILVVCLCVLIIVLISVSISCGVMRHRAIAHIHTFTRNPVTASHEVQIPELEVASIQTLEHIHR